MVLSLDQYSIIKYVNSIIKYINRVKKQASCLLTFKLFNMFLFFFHQYIIATHNENIRKSACSCSQILHSNKLTEVNSNEQSGLETTCLLFSMQLHITLP